MEKTKFTEPKSAFVNVNGIMLRTLDWGGEGEPIVVLHATGFLGRIYRPLAERLREIGHVYLSLKVVAGLGDARVMLRAQGNSPLATSKAEFFLPTMKTSLPAYALPSTISA